MAMVKWEYLREAIGADDLGARGMEGWELVAIADRAGVMIYKRPMAEAPPKPVAVPMTPEPAAQLAPETPAAAVG